MPAFAGMTTANWTPNYVALYLDHVPIKRQWSVPDTKF
jgi:hypothetical protein